MKPKRAMRDRTDTLGRIRVAASGWAKQGGGSRVVEAVFANGLLFANGLPLGSGLLVAVADDSVSTGVGVA